MTNGSLLNDKKNDPFELNTESKVIPEGGRRLFFNRPSYIRKLKKIAEEVENSLWDNSRNYYTDVVKLYECNP